MLTARALLPKDEMGKGVDVGSETCHQHSQVTDMWSKNYSSGNVVLEIWLLQAWGELRRAFLRVFQKASAHT